MSMAKRLKKFLICLTLLVTAYFFMNGNVFAQTTRATLEGMVTDKEGAALPGSEAIVRNMETGYVHTTITRTDGTYIISGIQPGVYEVEIKLTGFKTQIRRGMTFAVGAKLKIDFTLEPATVDEEITVVGEAPMVEVTKSEISSVVDRQKIEDLPLLNRDFNDLAILKAGVIGGRSNAMPTGMGELMIDGMSNENIIQNGLRLAVPADAIQEFRVMTNQVEAEYGNSSGMIRTAITRSGTNEFRGRVNYFYRNELFDTPNYFVNHDKYKGEELPKDEWEKADYKHHNVAGFIGGPIKKDKAHFFLAYDGRFRTTYETITSPLVPRETIDVTERTNQILLKLNYQLSEKHLLSCRFNLDRPVQDNLGVGGLNTKERAFKWVGNNFEIQLNWTFFPSDKSMNELRLLYVVDDADFDPLPEFADKYTINRPSGNFGKAANFAQYNFADRYQIVDNFSLFFGAHTLKTGFDFMYVPSGVTVFDLFIPGVYTFATDAPFNADDPATYPVTFMDNTGDPAFTLYIYQFGAFVQDSWRINPQLTLNLGFRYSYFTFTGLKLNAGDFNNFNPRFGFSWDPVGDGKTVIRGGIGTYTANVMANIAFPNEFYKDMALRILINPGYPDPFVPNPFAPPIEIPIPNPVYAVRPAPNPYSLQMTLGGQREVLADFSVGLDFVWTKGYSLITWRNENPIIVGTGFVHEDQTKGDIWNIENKGKSDYKGIYLTLNKRYSHGWSLEVAYTLGKQMGDTESQNYPWSYEDDAWERAWGRKDTDARHKLTVTGIVDIPLGFQLSGLLYYRSAYPWTAVYPDDRNSDGLMRGNPHWSIIGDYVDDYRNTRDGFDAFYINARVSKYIKISRFSIQFFGEIYNLTNRENWQAVKTTYGTEGFGEPTAAGDPRLMQLGVRFNW